MAGWAPFVLKAVLKSLQYLFHSNKPIFYTVNKTSQAEAQKQEVKKLKHLYMCNKRQVESMFPFNP